MNISGVELHPPPPPPTNNLLKIKKMLYRVLNSPALTFNEINGKKITNQLMFKKLY